MKKKNLDSAPNLITIALQDRIYTFSNGVIEIQNVEALEVTSSGFHRLKTASALYIVPPGWLSLKIIGPEE